MGAAMGGSPWKWPPCRKGGAGLTLVEVLIAAFVLVVAILGMAGAFPAALRQVSYGGQMTKAAALAHQMMEDVRGDPASSIPWYAGKDGRGVSTDVPSNFPDDWPWPCTSGWTWGDHFCGNMKLTRWGRDIIGDPGDGRPLANGRGTVSVVDHENRPPAGGAAASGSTTILRITVTVSWDEPTGRKQVALTSTVPCAWPGCS